MSSNLSVTQYNIGVGAYGTTEGGTSYSLTLSGQVSAGADFADADAWTLRDALLTALKSVGWDVADTAVSLSKVALNDTSYDTDTATKAFT